MILPWIPITFPLISTICPMGSFKTHPSADSGPWDHPLSRWQVKFWNLGMTGLEFGSYPLPSNSWPMSRLSQHPGWGVDPTYIHDLGPISTAGVRSYCRSFCRSEFCTWKKKSTVNLQDFPFCLQRSQLFIRFSTETMIILSKRAIIDSTFCELPRTKSLKNAEGSLNGAHF